MRAAGKEKSDVRKRPEGGAEDLAFDSRYLDDQYHERYGSVGDQSPDWSERMLRHIARELRWLRECGLPAIRSAPDNQ